jgi:hypothetical protein
MLRAALVSRLALVAEQSRRLSSAVTGVRLAALVSGLAFIAEQSGWLVRERGGREDQQGTDG